MEKKKEEIKKKDLRVTRKLGENSKEQENLTASEIKTLMLSSENYRGVVIEPLPVNDENAYVIKFLNESYEDCGFYLQPWGGQNRAKYKSVMYRIESFIRANIRNRVLIKDAKKELIKLWKNYKNLYTILFNNVGSLIEYLPAIEEPDKPNEPLKGFSFRRNIAALRDMPTLVESELIRRTQVENRIVWDNTYPPDTLIWYYDPWDPLVKGLEKPTAGYVDHVQRLGLGVYDLSQGSADRYSGHRALCVGSDKNRFTDLKLIQWTTKGKLNAQTIWISQSWFKDLLLDTGLGDAEEQLVDEEKKEYKYVITKNNFKLLQNQVQVLERENKELKAKLVEFDNELEDLKVGATKRGMK